MIEGQRFGAQLLYLYGGALDFGQLAAETGGQFASFAFTACIQLFDASAQRGEKLRLKLAAQFLRLGHTAHNARQREQSVQVGLAIELQFFACSSKRLDMTLERRQIVDRAVRGAIAR